MAKIALCIIATQKYIDFVPPLLESADKYFLNGHEVEYILFTDEINMPLISSRRFYKVYTDHEPWPAMTLKRYEMMQQLNLSRYDFVYYIDADMLFVAPVGDEILKPLIGVHHPGYYMKGGGAWETRKESLAYVKESKRSVYLSGGFQGGSMYGNAIKDLAANVAQDKENGITAVWHDESHWNQFYSGLTFDFTVLNPGYCMVEEVEKRKAWDIDWLEPKIIALSKDHKKYQK